MNMRFPGVALLALLPVLAASGQDPHHPPFSEDITFYQSFDNGEEADLSVGKPRVIWKSGEIRFEEGLRGKALVCGSNGGKLRFNRAGNLNFDKPGTIVCFYRPINWETEKNLPRLFLWGIESASGYIGFQGANDPKKVCMCRRPFQLMLLYGKRLPQKVYSIPAPGEKGCSGWHMLAFSWAGDQLFLKWDREPAKLFANGLPLTDNDFPDDHFSIGSSDLWKYLLDDFIVYGRKLSNDELNQLYDDTIKK